MNAMYRVMFYCNNEQVTAYVRTIANYGQQGCETGAIEHVFESLPPMPRDIAGVIVETILLH